MEKETVKKEMADVFLKRGEAAFLKGKYQETIKELTHYLEIEKAENCTTHQTDAYNMLGMLLFFAGYETKALDYYLSALESAREQDHTSGVVSTLLNIGLLYQSCKEYRRAMPYYIQAKEAAEHDLRSEDMLLLLYADIQIAQLHCRMEQTTEAKHIYNKIESFRQIVTEDEFLLTKSILDILLAENEGDYERTRRLAKEVIEYLKEDEQFVSQLDFYVDICELMFSFGNAKETRMILDLIRERIKNTDFLRFKMRIEQIEVKYQKEYGRQIDYETACKHYIMLHTQYEGFLTEFRKKNLQNMDSMLEVEEQKREFERRSKCDLATGLLNKNAFHQEVEQFLIRNSLKTMTALIFLDIDNFKQVNDNFGHLFGDEVIRTLADSLRCHFSENALCGRFGGDEFVVFLKEVEDVMSLKCQIEEFREVFSKIVFKKEEDVHITFSIGVSYNQGAQASCQTMLACADKALEKSKEYGKNQVSFYEIKRGSYHYA